MKKLLLCALVALLFASCAAAEDVPGYRRLKIKGTNVNIVDKVNDIKGKAEEGDEFIGASWPVDGVRRLIIFTIGEDGSLTFSPSYVHQDYVEELPLRDGDAERIAATDYGQRRGAPGTFGELFGANWHDIVRKFGSEVPHVDPSTGDKSGITWPVQDIDAEGVAYDLPGISFTIWFREGDPFGRTDTTVTLRKGAPELFGVKIGATQRSEAREIFSEPDEERTYKGGRATMWWSIPVPAGSDEGGSFRLSFDANGVLEEVTVHFYDPDTKVWPALFRSKASPSASPAASTGEMAFMRATVNATDVNLRQGPSVKTTAMDAANTGDLLIVEQDPIKNDEDGFEWYRIIDAPNRPDMKLPLYITSKFVDLSPLTKADAERVAKTELYKGFGDGARTPLKKNDWRVFYENCVKWIGANLHEMRRLWPNGKTSRVIDFGYADDMADYFSSLGSESPESHTFTTTYKADGFEATMHETVKSTSTSYVSTRSFEQAVITKRGAEICGVVIGSTTRDELAAMFGAPAREADGRMTYPGIYSDGERAGDDLLPYFYVDFTIEGGVVTKIEIAKLPVG